MNKEILFPVAIGFAVGTGLSLGMPPEEKKNGGRDKLIVLSGLVIGGVGLLAMEHSKIGGALLAGMGLTAMIRGQSPDATQGRRQLASGAVATMFGLGMYLGTPEIAKDISYVVLGMGATSITAGALDFSERKIASPA